MNILKSKAPIVAIPVEGKAPACIDGKRLRAWAKGVTIDSLDVVTTGGEWYCVEQGPCSWMGSAKQAEGPINLIAERSAEVRRLRIVGHVGGVRTSCTMNVIDRRTAVKKLGEWSEKERERISKRLMRGALTKDEQKAIKRSKFEDDGERMIPVSCHIAKDGSHVEKMGLPVTIPELSELEFALVKWGTDYLEYTVTELVTGQSCGRGRTGEEALFAARESARKLSDDAKAKLLLKVLDAVA